MTTWPKTCVSTPKTVDVLANDSDPDGDTLTITSIDGKSISNDQSVTLNDGVIVTLTSGKLVFDATNSDYDTLVVGQSATATYSYQISDGNGGTASADIDLKYCGIAEHAGIDRGQPARYRHRPRDPRSRSAIRSTRSP